jgi:hypothetical protein
MGCCGGVMKDQQIERAQNMDEVINVMKKKQENLSKEKKQISDYLDDESNQITMINTEAISKDDLTKRIPYLDKLSDCYGDIIDNLENTSNLPLKETKEYLYNVLNHYYVSYDESEGYKSDIERFKKFIMKYKTSK